MHNGPKMGDLLVGYEHINSVVIRARMEVMHAFPLSEANLIIFGAHLVRKRDRSTMSPNMSLFLNVISKRDSRVPA